MMRVLHFALWLALQGNSPTSSVASMTSLALPVDMSSRPRSASSLSVGVACRLSHCFVPVSWHGCSRSSWCVPASSAFISRSCRIFLSVSGGHVAHASASRFLRALLKFRIDVVRGTRRSSSVSAVAVALVCICIVRASHSVRDASCMLLHLRFVGPLHRPSVAWRRSAEPGPCVDMFQGSCTRPSSQLCSVELPGALLRSCVSRTSQGRLQGVDLGGLVSRDNCC